MGSAIRNRQSAIAIGNSTSTSMSRFGDISDIFLKQDDKEGDKTRERKNKRGREEERRIRHTRQRSINYQFMVFFASILRHALKFWANLQKKAVPWTWSPYFTGSTHIMLLEKT
jgi:hypothetical protein